MDLVINMGPVINVIDPVINVGSVVNVIDFVMKVGSVMNVIHPVINVSNFAGDVDRVSASARARGGHGDAHLSPCRLWITRRLRIRASWST